MVRLNGMELKLYSGMTLLDLVSDYNDVSPIEVDVEGYIIVVNDLAVTSDEAEELILAGEEEVYIVPIFDSG